MRARLRSALRRAVGRERGDEERARGERPAAGADQGADEPGSDADEDGSDGPALADGGVARSDGDAAPGGPSTLGDRLSDRFGPDFLESTPFWLPPFLLMGLFVYGAILWNLLLSLTDHNRIAGSPDYSDLDFEMYARAIGDPNVVNAAVNTLLLVVAFTLGTLVLGLALAILIDRGIRFENAFRTVYLLPMSLSFVVNILLGVVNLGPVDWLGNQAIVLWAVVFALVWQFSGYAMVVYLAGLRAIPTDQYEAAKVDGASSLKMYWRVIVPQLKGATISAAVVLMVFALKAFDFLYSLVGGYRPPAGSDILATKMVREAYSNTNFAYGAAIAIILFVMALAIIGPYLVYQYRRGHL